MNEEMSVALAEKIFSIDYKGNATPKKKRIRKFRKKVEDKCFSHVILYFYGADGKNGRIDFQLLAIKLISIMDDFLESLPRRSFLVERDYRDLVNILLFQNGGLLCKYAPACLINIECRLKRISPKYVDIFYKNLADIVYQSINPKGTGNITCKTNLME
jgi:hypothetical protein